MLTDQTNLCNLILQAKQVSQAVEEAQSLKGACRQMGKQVCQLAQMLNTLCCFTTLNLTLLTYLNPLHFVITEVSDILQEALSLACTSKRKTILYPLFTGTKITRFHNLYHLLDVSIANMNWLLILYDPDFGSAFNDIFTSLSQTLDYSFTDLWILSGEVTEKIICKLATNLKSETSSIGLKVCSAEALSMLDLWSAISEIIGPENTVGQLMLGLAKLVEAECGHEVQYSCLKSIAEITAAAESNLDLRCKAFKSKTNSFAAKAIVKQLLRVINESENPKLLVLAIKSIGSLARMFRKGDKHVISVFVSQLGNRNQEVVTEALVALQKFTCGHNYLGKAHSNTMIEFHAVQHMMKLLRDFERTQNLHALTLICEVTMKADYSKVMGEARVRSFLEQLLTTKEGSLDFQLK